MVRSSRPRLSETGGSFMPTGNSTLSYLAHALFHLFQQVEGIGRISFPYLERKEVSSCRLRGKLSSLLSRDVSYLERKEVSSCRLSGKRSSLLSHEVGGVWSVSRF